jgi:serine protease Do
MRLYPAILVLLLAAAPATAEDMDPLSIAEALEQAFVEVADRVGPAVVTLDVSGSVIGPEGMGELRTGGAGSGFIVSADGLIYTNNHVLEDASRIEVVMRDGRRFKADRVGADPLSDIGVARILDPPPDLPFVELGDSDAVRVGQYALAIGSPFGLDYADTFTVGHVSAKGRNRLGRENGLVAPGFGRLVDQDFIQVDTLIKPGNSGGPLLDIRGRVIGVNTAIVGSGADAGMRGLAFAVPINLAREVAIQLVASGRVVRGWVGARTSTPDPQILKMGDAPMSSGAHVKEVVPDSPAAAGGLEEGDIVTEIGGRNIRTREDFRSAVVRSVVGKPLEFVVWRDGKKPKTLRLSVIPIERPPEPERTVQRRPRAGTTAYLTDRIGAEFGPTDKATNRTLGRKPSAGGVHVRGVESNSIADRAGLLSGDVILKIDHRDVNTPEEVADAVRSAGREFVPLLVERKGKTKGLSIEQP